ADPTLSTCHPPGGRESSQTDDHLEWCRDCPRRRRRTAWHLHRTRSTCAGSAGAPTSDAGHPGSDSRTRTRARSSGSRVPDRSVDRPPAPAPAVPSARVPLRPSRRRYPTRPLSRPTAHACSLRRVSQWCGTIEPTRVEVGAEFLLDADLRGVVAVKREILEVAPEAVGTIGTGLVGITLDLGEDRVLLLGGQLHEQALKPGRAALVKVDQSFHEATLAPGIVVIRHDPFGESVALGGHRTGRVGGREDSLARRRHSVHLVMIEETGASPPGGLSVSVPA